MKKVYFFLLAMCLMGASCKENEEKTPEIGNPLTDLPWLKGIVDEFEKNAEVMGYNSHARIYQCAYREGTGFLLEMCVGCPDAVSEFRSSEGTVLRSGKGSSVEDKDDQGLNIDFKNKKLIWEKTGVASPFACCGVNNPLTDLPWLKELVDYTKRQYEDLKASGHNSHFGIYQCAYKDGSGFLWAQLNTTHTAYLFYNCEGEELCISGGGELHNCPSDVDSRNKKLIWEIQPDPPMTVDSLHTQSLHIIQKCVLGKWWINRLWSSTAVQYYSDVFVDISENTVVVSGNDINYTFSYSWKKMEVHPPYPDMSSYATFVMWNDEQNRGEWSFYNLQNDFLEINKYDRSGVYTLIRIRE